MTDAIDRRILAQRAEVQRRLADRAEAAGIELLVLDPRTGEHVATDPEHPARVFRVDIAGCACRRFQIWSRCGHHALLLAELGWIADDGAFPCRACAGALVASGGARCRSCDGRGWVPPATIVVAGETRVAHVAVAA